MLKLLILMQHATWQMIQAGTCLPGVVILFFWLFSGEVKHFVRLIRLNLNSRLCPCGLIDHGPVLGVTPDYLGVNWVPLILCCWFLFRHQLVPHSVPNFSPVPLCNVSWGLGVCPVLVRSVSPCRLVLEVRLFPSSPLRCFWHSARRLCPLFLFLLPFRVDPAPAGCVCITSEQM